MLGIRNLLFGMASVVSWHKHAGNEEGDSQVVDVVHGSNVTDFK